MRRRLLLLALLLSSLLLLAMLSFSSLPLPLPAATVHVQAPYQAEPLLNDYTQLFWAERRGEARALQHFVAEAPDTFLRYRVLLRLARDETLSARERLRYLDEVLAYGLISPLARNDVKRAQLERAALAEAAGDIVSALASYGEALPLRAAAAGLRRLERNPRTLARLFLDARDPESALRALRGISAPAIRAPALAAMGESEAALRVYNRWLERVPASLAARWGKFRVLLALARYPQAEALLHALPRDPEARAALAEARDDPEAALAAYLEVGDESSLWQAAGLLEEAGRNGAALELYLELAQTGLRENSDLQDDAAYRAYILARRSGSTAVMRRADRLIPAFSFFGMLRGKPLPTATSPLAKVTPLALQRAQALQRVGDSEAALGELLIALGQSENEATTIALAEALQKLGEFGSSSEAARDYVEQGSRAHRTWLVAYPRAYQTVVEGQAATLGLRPAFIWAIMRQESHFYPRAVSTSEAQGLMQVVPDTWNWLAELQGEAAADPFDARSNIRYGTFYVANLLTMFGGDLPQSAAAYNGGPGYIGRLLEAPRIRGEADFYRFIGRDETREYVQRVMLNVAVYRALYAQPKRRAAR